MRQTIAPQGIDIEHSVFKEMVISRLKHITFLKGFDDSFRVSFQNGLMEICGQKWQRALLLVTPNK